MVCVVAQPGRLFAQGPDVTVSKLRLDEIPFDGRQAFVYLQQLCSIGPRPSGSAGMIAQQRLLKDYFARLGGAVSVQDFGAHSPLDPNVVVPMSNIIVQWHPERAERILLCAHYDTKPYPDRDKVNPGGILLGANDGASGVALLMELGKWMPRLESKYGVDFALFDGSQFIFKTGDWTHAGDPRFLGAEYFARAYSSSQPPFKYHAAVLLDMVGYERLQLPQESDSMGWRDTRPTVEEIWRTAYQIGVREFIPVRKHFVSDDHLRLHDIGKIPTCAVVDFDDPYWRTQQDTPAHCSPLALAKVGWVMEEWLKTAK
jgi:hypothetical protein